ncbi:MAG: RNA pseudouridine synthase [Patescibacteria group bacterium]|nr:RNA pseudouridine synthase [Patescibacteria group bacterium]
MLEPKIIWETNDYLVLNKPAGWTVHGGAGISGPLLTDWLHKHYPSINDVGDNYLRPGIVHRLDKEASGLMVVAKTNTAWQYFKELFKSRQVGKTYWALVHGQIAKDEGVLNFPIKRASSGHRMVALPFIDQSLTEKKNLNNRDRGLVKAREKAKNALTKFNVLKRFINYTLVEVKIKTGRTHQIRVHFFAYGHPLLGDQLYTTKKTKVKNEKAKLERIFLIAKSLKFKDPAGDDKIFEIDLPADLESFLNGSAK